MEMDECPVTHSPQSVSNPSWVGVLAAVTQVVCVQTHSFLKGKVKDPKGLDLDPTTRNSRCDLCVRRIRAGQNYTKCMLVSLHCLSLKCLS